MVELALTQWHATKEDVPQVDHMQIQYFTDFLQLNLFGKLVVNSYNRLKVENFKPIYISNRNISQIKSAQLPQGSRPDAANGLDLLHIGNGNYGFSGFVADVSVQGMKAVLLRYFSWIDVKYTP